MGRRVVAGFDPVKDYRQAGRALRVVLERYDLGQFQAQLHAADAVEILAGFMSDMTLEPEFRRACANDVLNRAGGVPTERAEVPPPDPHALVPGTEHTAGEEIEAVRVTASAFMALERWMSVPPDQWPPEVQQALGAAAFSPATDPPAGSG